MAYSMSLNCSVSEGSSYEHIELPLDPPLHSTAGILHQLQLIGGYTIYKTGCLPRVVYPRKII